MLGKICGIIFLVVILSVLVSKAVWAIDGFGQAHILNGAYIYNPGVKTGYSASSNFDVALGGDGWPSAEQQRGVFTWLQLEGEVNSASGLGKKLWLQLHSSQDLNKEHNVPRWALDLGVETIEPICGNNKRSTPYSSVASGWDNRNLLDNTEYQISADGKTVTYPIRIAAVWDPKYRSLFANALREMKKKFQTKLDDGTIQAIGLMSGGEYGESFIAAKVGVPDCVGKTGCVPDVANPSCPAIQSLARVTGRPISEITSRSKCNDGYNIATRIGAKVEVCDPSKETCPEQAWSPCYAFDDYYIQGVKDLIVKYMEIFDKTPIVFQDGAGMSGTGRTNYQLKNWAVDNFGSRVWLKFNGWGPAMPTSDFGYYFWNRTRHGYEPSVPYFFSRENFRKSCIQQNNCVASSLVWPVEKPCDSTKVNNCCTQAQLQACDDNAIKIIRETVYKGIVNDYRGNLPNRTSSYLIMQGNFFDVAPIDKGGGKAGNFYYFNPNDQTPTCANSEISVLGDPNNPQSANDVGWCPGFFNNLFSKVSEPGAAIYPNLGSSFLAKAGTNLLSNINFTNGFLPGYCHSYTSKINGFWTVKNGRYSQPLTSLTNFPKLWMVCQ